MLDASSSPIVASDHATIGRKPNDMNIFNLKLIGRPYFYATASKRTSRGLYRQIPDAATELEREACTRRIDARSASDPVINDGDFGTITV